MSEWNVAGRSAATDAAANGVCAQLWNPHSTKRVRVNAVHLFHQAATTPQIGIRRSTARGATPGSTVTPTIASDTNRDIAPPSGAVLELANFTTEPTLEGVDMWRWAPAAVAGSGVIWVPRNGILIPPGSGLCIAVAAGTTAIGISDVTFECEG